MPRKPGAMQQRIMQYIQKAILENGYPPSVREIGEAVGLKSPSTVHGHLNRMEKAGLIRRDPAKNRAIELLDGASAARREMLGAPLVGRVTAGAPILATQNIEETLPIPAFLAEGGDAFLLRVRGDSMIEAGIHDGDYVIVKRQNTADNGDIIVALLDEEATVKRFFKEKGRCRLQPENPSYAPIYSTDVKVLGRVTGLMRKM
nr:transcriptional repressor LexA [bacterium]